MNYFLMVAVLTIAGAVAALTDNLEALNTVFPILAMVAMMQAVKRAPRAMDKELLRLRLKGLFITQDKNLKIVYLDAQEARIKWLQAAEKAYEEGAIGLAELCKTNADNAKQRVEIIDGLFIHAQEHNEIGPFTLNFRHEWNKTFQEKK